MCVSVSVSACVPVCVCVHVYVHAFMCVCASMDNMFFHASVLECRCVCVCACVHVNVCLYMCVCMFCLCMYCICRVVTTASFSYYSRNHGKIAITAQCSPLSHFCDRSSERRFKLKRLLSMQNV